jgi:hypothetical protein
MILAAYRVADSFSSEHNSSWRMPSSGMRGRIDLVWTDVSEEGIASIFRVEKSAIEKPAWAGGSRRPSETSVHRRSIRRHIPGDSNLHRHRRENLKSYIITLFITASISRIIIASIKRPPLKLPQSIFNSIHIFTVLLFNTFFPFTPPANSKW